MGRTYSVGTSAPDVVAWYCHTGRSMYDTIGGTMSEPMYLQGDDFALGINQACDDCDEVDCACGQPDRMSEDDE